MPPPAAHGARPRPRNPSLSSTIAIRMKYRTRALLSSLLALVAWTASDRVRADQSYSLQPGDMLTISVWKEPDLTSDILVRPDGGITMPLAGEIAAAGHSVEDVRAAIDQRLRKFIPDPSVTVIVKQTLGNQIFVIGKVNRPGQYPINRLVDVMQALSMAGGTTPFAAINDIRVLRRLGDQQITLPFRYTDIEHGRDLKQNILLQSGDTVVVP
jgi:polysaccharide export outer membrane protein